MKFPIWWRVTLQAVVVALTAVPLHAQSTMDDRPGVDATIFFGLSIDTFSAEELRTYLNPQDSGNRRERFVGGFNFEYRLVGRGDDRGGQFWIFGETIHGVRSADVNCAVDPETPVCGPFNDTTGAQPVLFAL